MLENQPLPPMVEKKTIRLADIHTDGGTQAREGLDDEAIEEYALAIKRGEKLPPLKVVWDQSRYWLWDGFHTLHAAQAAGKRSWVCEVWHGNLSLARLLAASANQGHGIRRSNVAKRRAVEMVLAERPDWSNMRIAEHCGVGDDLVRNVRAACPQVPENGTSPTIRIGRDGKVYPASPTRKAEESAGADDAVRTPETPRGDTDSSAPPAPYLPDDPGLDPKGESDDPKPAPPEPTPPAAPAAQARPQPEAPPPILDAVGLVVPDDRLIPWNARDRFAGIISRLRQAQRDISDLAQSDGGQHLRQHCELTQDSDGRQSLKLDRITSAIRQLESSRPHAMTCPYCHAAGAAARPSCPACKGRGWVTKSIWDAAPPEHRAAATGEAA